MGILINRPKNAKDQWFFPSFVDKGICTLQEWRTACEEIAGWVDEQIPDDLYRNRNRPPPPKAMGPPPFGSIFSKPQVNTQADAVLEKAKERESGGYDNAAYLGVVDSVARALGTGSYTPSKPQTDWRTPFGSIEKPMPRRGEIRYIEGCRRRYDGDGGWVIID